MTDNASPTPPPALSHEDHELLQRLRHHRRRHRHGHRETIGIKMPPPMTRGQRLADGVARVVGSWRFIGIQSAIIVAWIVVNQLHPQQSWDPYPFILLNLVLSFQAAYTAPAIMMSQNRQSEVDRLHAENDFEVNVKAELEIELLHQKIDLLREREIQRLTTLVETLTQRLESAQQPSRPT